MGTHDRLHGGISYRSSTPGAKGMISETSKRSEEIQRNKDFFFLMRYPSASDICLGVHITIHLMM